MAVHKRDVLMHAKLTQNKESLFCDVQEVLDRLLLLNKGRAVDIALVSLENATMRKEIKRWYSAAGWKIQFTRAAGEDFYFVHIS